MEAYTEAGQIVLGGNARQRFYDARGYGRPLGGNEIALSRVEAAHLLLRGDLDAVDGMDFTEFFEMAPEAGFVPRFLVYADLRDRGFYLSPAREPRIDDPDDEVDFIVYARGTGPESGDVAHRVRVVDERESIASTSLGDHVLAVVDEESEVTYFETDRPGFDGETTVSLPEAIEGSLLTDRAVCWAPPAALYERAFYGQPLAERVDDVDAVQFSLVEAAQLVETDVLDLEGGLEAVVERGRAVEGERFDRRLQVYSDLRHRGVVPKTGFKFGADFRTYANVESVDDLGHSERLVRVVPSGSEFTPRELALDVRMAHGVRKDLIVAWPDGDDGGASSRGAVHYVRIRRLTP